MFLVGMILFGIPSAAIAASKGFAPLRWLIAFGLIGLVTVSCLESGKSEEIPDEKRMARIAKANRVGATMALINLGIGVVAFVATLAMQ